MIGIEYLSALGRLFPDRTEKAHAGEDNGDREAPPSHVQKPPEPRDKGQSKEPP